MKEVLLILDLDSTVISSLSPTEPQPADLIGHDFNGDYMIYERPHLQEFLDYIFANFQVAVWTAAEKTYALFIVDNILLQRPGRKIEFFFCDIQGKISMAHFNGPKDLRLVWSAFSKYNSTNTLIIDDFRDVYGMQLPNAYPIEPFEADEFEPEKDTALVRLQKKLDKVKTPNEFLSQVLITKKTQDMINTN